MPDSVSEYMSEGMPGRIICHVECEIEWQNICQRECPVELCPVECKIERQNIYIYMFISDRMSVGGDHSKKTFFFRG